MQTAQDLASSIDSAEGEHLRLWAHEIIRSFGDRIRDVSDRDWFLEMIKVCCVALCLGASCLLSCYARGFDVCECRHGW